MLSQDLNDAAYFAYKRKIRKPSLSYFCDVTTIQMQNRVWLIQMHKGFAEGTVTHGRVWDLKDSAFHLIFKAILVKQNLC